MSYDDGCCCYYVKFPAWLSLDFHRLTDRLRPHTALTRVLRVDISTLEYLANCTAAGVDYKHRRRAERLQNPCLCMHATRLYWGWISALSSASSSSLSLLQFVDSAYVYTVWFELKHPHHENHDIWVVWEYFSPNFSRSSSTQYFVSLLNFATFS